MSVLRATLPLALLAACTSSSPELGIASFVDANEGCGVGMVPVDVGWSLVGACVGTDIDPGTPHCSDLDVAHSAAPFTVVVTKAAIAATGAVPVTVGSQTRDVASVAITYSGMSITDGTFGLSTVEGSLTGNFNIDAGSSAISGTIVDAPYCP